jgi:hypothetical protein
MVFALFIVKAILSGDTMAEDLQFTDTPISLLSTGLLAGGYTGTLTVDYTTNTVTGSVLTSPALGNALPLLNF